MIELTDKTFRSMTQAGWWVIHFWAKDCSPCQPLSKILGTLEEQWPELSFGKVNGREELETTIQQRVRGYPTMIIYHDGEPVDYIFGLRGEKEIQERIKASLQGQE